MRIEITLDTPLEFESTFKDLEKLARRIDRRFFIAMISMVVLTIILSIISFLYMSKTEGKGEQAMLSAMGVDLAIFVIFGFIAWIYIMRARQVFNVAKDAFLTGIVLNTFISNNSEKVVDAMRKTLEEKRDSITTEDGKKYLLDTIKVRLGKISFSD